MKNPALIPQPYAHWIANILARFEDGKPLSSDQLNFLISHENTLCSHALDLVIKYYLSSHHSPDKHLSFTVPAERIDRLNAHEIRDAVENLLHYELSHVDLKMSAEQFLKFKAVGFHELIFWHGPQFLSQTMPFPNASPLVLYFQWGKLFGVVKLNAHMDNFIMDGNVLIYFEDINDRSLNQCVLDYTKNHKIIHDFSPKELDLSCVKTSDQQLSFLPRSRFGSGMKDESDI